MKNKDLCERPYCREPWTKLVSAYNEIAFRGRRTWQLRVCDLHAEFYETDDARQDRYVRVSITKRCSVENKPC